MLGVPQRCEYTPEENHSSTELEMHMEVKEQAALSGIAERGSVKPGLPSCTMSASIP